MKLNSENGGIENITPEKFPGHVLIIPDGNGRWAKRFQRIPSFGHRQGFKILQKVIKKFQALPIRILTIWAFSSDNWKRDEKEIQALMELFEHGINEALPEMIEKKTRFLAIGRKDRLPRALLKTITNAEKQTKKFGPKILCIAIDYSGQDQEIRMMEKVRKIPRNKKVDLELIEKLRDGDGLIPPADLIIRTSGEMRISDLGWIAQNSEFYSIKKLLPETSPVDFYKALVDYSKRDRRFGGR